MQLSPGSITKMAVALLCATAGGLASASTIWIFGDSLTDPGNLRAATIGQLPPPFEVPPDPPYPEGVRTNGNNWANYLDDDFQHADITNAAVAGAIAGEFLYELAPSVFVPIDNLNDITVFGVQAAGGQVPHLLPDVIGLQEQVARFGGTSSAADIGVFWIGANDFFASTLAPVFPSPLDVVEDIKSAARELHDKGVQTLVLGNLPDLGKTPLAQLTGSPGAFTAASLAFNAALVGAAADPSGMQGSVVFVMPNAAGSASTASKAE